MRVQASAGWARILSYMPLAPHGTVPILSVVVGSGWRVPERHGLEFRPKVSDRWGRGAGEPRI